MLTQRIFTVLLTYLCLAGTLLEAAPTSLSPNLVRIIIARTDKQLTITDEGYLEETYADACIHMFTASTDNGVSTTEFGQIVQGTSYIITAYSDNKVTGVRSNNDAAQGSGDDRLAPEAYTKFSVTEPFGSGTQLKMNIEGTEKCLSFTDSSSQERRKQPIMVDCNGADFFYIVEGSC